LHFALTGLALFYFGAEGSRTPAFSDQAIRLGPVSVSGQSQWDCFPAAPIGVVSPVFRQDHLRQGAACHGDKSDWCAAERYQHRDGRPVELFLAVLIGAFSGILIAPITTIYYDSGFLVGLKGFVRGNYRRIGQRYPLAAAGGDPGRFLGVLLVVLGERVQGSHRLYAHHPGVAGALSLTSTQHEEEE
jgi:branched-chain amino acid transport system permease protein